jgi:cell shape-determining protein MreC
MIGWISLQIIFSLLIIVLAHSVYKFLKNNLTTPKTRDMINTPINQYKDIYKKNEDSIIVPDNTTSSNKDTDTESMKNELQAYLTELKENNTLEPKTDIDIFDNFSNNYESI